MTATSKIASFLPDRRSRAQPHRRSPYRNVNAEDLSSSEKELQAETRPDVEELRKRRADFYTTHPEDRRIPSGRVMAERVTLRRSSTARISSAKKPEVTVREVRRSHSSDHHRRRRRQETQHDEQEPEYVNVYNSKPPSTKPPPLQRSRTTTTATGSRPREARRVSEDLTRHHTERRKTRHREDDGNTRRVVDVSHDSEAIHLSRSRRSRPSVSRSTSVRETVSLLPQRPSLHRSHTTTRKVRPVSQFNPPTQEDHPPTPSVAKSSHRPSSFFGSILGKSKPAPPPPEKQVECLTCLSTYPSSRTAHLPCGHRMCHSCLRRIFTLSVTDPQHMPPKCCNPSQHIPLKHVDKLFDLKFKMKWNQKYQEYNTKNRLYCPKRGCGEWIKPANIHTDISGGANTGRKYGKCSRCKTKVCTQCNGRWHSSRTCPKDDATKQFIEIAKQEGWQRCFNCSATVELKEGCNHMTCRCKAEFCMICGVKWKGCDCPWFNYQTVEQDRLAHMNVPPVVRRVVVDGQEVDENHPRAARGYQAEIDARREQERRDEELARRLQAVGLNPPGVGIYQVVENAEYGAQIWGETPANPHTFVNRTTNGISVSYNTARQPQPVLRQHSQASRAYNNRAAAAERVVPRRAATGYDREAAVHAPLRSATVGMGEVPRMAAMADEPTGSALAGLTRGGVAEGRVEEWRRWVEAG
ncbi:MAG: hypothetical protein Q9184_007444 [Pyrenodesmia sp. 2 TL-2023]